MHAGAEGGTGIYVEDQAGLLFMSVFHDLFRLLPGRDDKDIVDPELVEVLLPVVDPVDVLGLVDADGPLPHVGKGPDLVDLGQHSVPDLLRCADLVVDDQAAVLCFLQKEVQDRGPVVRGALGEDIHEHLLLLRGGQGDVVLDLGPVETDVLHKADQYILCVRPGADPESHPFHICLKSFPADRGGMAPPPYL